MTTFRPSSRDRARIALGVLMTVVAVGVVLLIFSSVDRRRPVLQLVRDVAAGDRLTASDVRTVEVSAEPTLQVVPAADLPTLVGRYAKVRLAAGALLVLPALQDGPLVTPGSAVVAVVVAAGELPAGLRERSRVRVVLAGDATTSAPQVLDARVVGLPSRPDAVTGTVSVSLELSEQDAPTLAAAATARLILLDPDVDPVSAP